MSQEFFTARVGHLSNQHSLLFECRCLLNGSPAQAVKRRKKKLHKKGWMVLDGAGHLSGQTLRAQNTAIQDGGWREVWTMVLIQLRLTERIRSLDLRRSSRFTCWPYDFGLRAYLGESVYDSKSAVGERESHLRACLSV